MPTPEEARKFQEQRRAQEQRDAEAARTQAVASAAAALKANDLQALSKFQASPAFRLLDKSTQAEIFSRLNPQ